MARKWLLVVLILAGVLFCLLGRVVPVAAQAPTPRNDENCVYCHTHRYYLYDSGKWFCLCDAPMHCVYCHGGRTDSFDKDIAHEGIVLYPTRNNAERCKDCHTEDYLDRVVTFGAAAGVSPTPQPVPTATENTTAGAVVAALPARPLLHIDYLEPWRLAGLAVIAIVLLLVAVFGYHCYKDDCLMRSRG
jgi:hypothetical protein